MPYEHCLIFGAREYFWDDETFHDDCIGIVIDETDRDDELNLREEVSLTQSSKSCSTQTEPWGPPEAAAEAATERLRSIYLGMSLPNPKICPSIVSW